MGHQPQGGQSPLFSSHMDVQRVVSMRQHPGAKVITEGRTYRHMKWTSKCDEKRGLRAPWQLGADAQKVMKHHFFGKQTLSSPSSLSFVFFHLPEGQLNLLEISPHSNNVKFHACENGLPASSPVESKRQQQQQQQQSVGVAPEGEQLSDR
jgi:hypothetical protein